MDVGKKNPGRTYSTDRRVIADTRRVNMAYDPTKYYDVNVPPNNEISRAIVAQARQRP